MNILSVDTAGRSCSVAIHSGEALMCELMVNSGLTHTRVVLDLVKQALTAHRMTLADMDGFAVSTGPGSFTGLRIGLSTVKGFAAAASKPLAGIPTLKALAYPFGGHTALIRPMLDARKGEVYTQGFRFTGDRMVETGPEQVLPPEAAVSQIREPVVVVGDGALAYRKIIIRELGGLAIFPPASGHLVRAAAVGDLAVFRFAEGHTDTAESLVPRYIRKSDAERNRLRA